MLLFPATVNIVMLFKCRVEDTRPRSLIKGVVLQQTDYHCVNPILEASKLHTVLNFGSKFLIMSIY